MTEQEAIDGLRFTMDMMTWRQGVEGAYNCDPSELNKDSKLTYDGCEFAIQVIEKQIPMKPIKSKIQTVRYVTTYDCPYCGNRFIGYKSCNYCYHCGQKLNWSKET